VRVNNGRTSVGSPTTTHPLGTTQNLYEVRVTIEKISGVAKPHALSSGHRLDIYPTAFMEYVTLNAGTASPTNKLFRLDTMVLTTATRATSRLHGDRWAGRCAVDRRRAGNDIGACFDFRFRHPRCIGGRSQVSFVTYYGATGNESDAILT